MNILMLGNSFTYCNDMPGMLACGAALYGLYSLIFSLIR